MCIRDRNLGEHDFIGKHNLMNTSTHVPLIVRVPGMKKGKTKSMVEFVDLYPNRFSAKSIMLHFYT